MRVLMRGTEGEPVADARRLQRLDVYVGGVARADLSLPAQEGVLRQAPMLLRSNDAATTACAIQAIVSGAMPAPAPIAAQVACLLRVLDALGTPVEASCRRESPRNNSRASTGRPSGERGPGTP